MDDALARLVQRYDLKTDPAPRRRGMTPRHREVGRFHFGGNDHDDFGESAGLHPLCDWRDHAEGCPKFKADALLARATTAAADHDRLFETPLKPASV